MQNRRLNFMYTKIAVAFADTKPTENAFGSNILSLRDWRRSFQTRRETQPMIASDATALVWITLSSSLLGAMFAYAENRPHGIADFVNTELHGALAA